MDPDKGYLDQNKIRFVSGFGILCYLVVIVPAAASQTPEELIFMVHRAFFISLQYFIFYNDIEKKMNKIYDTHIYR